MYHTAASSPSFCQDHVCDVRDFPNVVALELLDFLKVSAEVWVAQFSPDGKQLAACGSAEHVIIWDVATFKVACRLTHPEGGVGYLAWSPDSTMLVTCSQDKYARLWDSKVSISFLT